VAVIGVGAQESGDEMPVEPATDRPAETELLLDAADDAGDTPAADEGPELPGIGIGDFVRMILVLGIVIALIYGFFWILKRFSGVKAEGEDAIRLVSTRPLKGDAALHLVEVGHRVFLVGSCGSTVNLVSEIDDKESIDEIHLEASRESEPVSGGFAKLFRDRFGGRPSPAPEAPPEESADPADYLKRQRERLKDL